MKGLAVARWMLAVVACAAVVAYARVIHAPFLAWDDDRNILLNPFVRSGHIGALWAAPWFGLYVPVTSTAWAGLSTGFPALQRLPGEGGRPAQLR
jgi:hypothetical protein